jgi:hypothetical protein
VLGSNDDVTWTTLVGSATYTWNSSTGNTVSIALPSGASDRYVELSFTAKSVRNGAQAAELSVFAAGRGSAWFGRSRRRRTARPPESVT